MSTNTPHEEKDLHQVFREIRAEAEKAQTHEELTELYKRTGYMITMTHATPVEEKTDTEIKERRAITESEFSETVHAINSRAKEIGVEAGFNESWNGLAPNGYDSKSENLLEAEDNDHVEEGQLTAR